MTTAQSYTINPALPEDYTMRAAVMDDLQAVVELINVCAQSELNIDMVTPDNKRDNWETPGFDVTTDTWVIHAPDGALVGYEEFWNLAPHVKNYCWGRVHLDHVGKGIGTHLLAQAEHRARSILDTAPDGARVVLVNNGPDTITNEAALALLETRGFLPMRYFHYMEIAFTDDNPPPVPQWPEGITVRPYDPVTETRVIYDTIEDAFQDHWGHVHLAFDLWKRWNIDEDEHHDPALWFVAQDSAEIAGAVLCVPFVMGEPGKGLISELGVRRAWRRRGLGRALLLHAFQALVARGLHTIELAVDSQSLTGATHLYESVGMTRTSTWVSSEKELRAGVDISDQEMSLQADE